MLTIQPIMNSIDATNGSKQSDDFQSVHYNNDDDFGDFTDFQNNKTIDDDFGEFTFFQTSTNEGYKYNSDNGGLETEQQIGLNNDDFGDFAYFQSGSCENNKSMDDDDFGDFSDFKSNDEPNLTTDCIKEKDLNLSANNKIENKLEHEAIKVEEDDDFGDFANFQEASPVIDNEETSRSIKQTVLSSDTLEFSPSMEDESSSVNYSASHSPLSSIVCQSFAKGMPDESNKVIPTNFFADKTSQSYKMWQSLINWEEAASLKLNWESSHTFQVFLRSLKIDSRNIQMPGLRDISTPLIPSKLTILQPTPLLPSIIPLEPQISQQMSQDPMNSLEKQEQSASTIPEASFDWNSSGLTNPLEKDWLILL
ncbi:aftiphilin isoform X2 [Tetranychus urticae]|uniref:aftiphilin isoform X2 n=1 Tax=Tetranychus urticae TaxID=32264 RepID=UPI00077BC15A|nr:aftiphilin isoform X2 [Tetranychus urticae]